MIGSGTRTPYWNGTPPSQNAVRMTIGRIGSTANTVR